MNKTVKELLLNRQSAQSFGNLWDFDLLTSTFWLSLHPNASRQSAITIATGVSAATNVGDTAGLNLAQATASSQPTYNATGFNNYPAISFDGGDDFFATASNFPLTGNPAFTVISVAQKTVVNRGHLFGWGNASDPLRSFGRYDDNGLMGYAYAGGNTFALPAYPTSQLIITYTKASGAINANSAEYRNGVLQTPTSAPASTPNTAFNPLSIGRWANLDVYFQGLLSEFIVIPKVLSTDERNRAEGILAHRWWRLAGQSIPLATDHPYYTSPPTSTR
jgi:hypothetical protein